jgi:hypothetical protein
MSTPLPLVRMFGREREGVTSVSCHVAQQTVRRTSLTGQTDKTEDSLGAGQLQRESQTHMDNLPGSGKVYGRLAWLGGRTMRNSRWTSQALQADCSAASCFVSSCWTRVRPRFREDGGFRLSLPWRFCAA